MEIYDKKFVELGNGEKYAFIETGKGAPLLLIHGNMSSGVHFSPILPALAEKFHCFAPDLRGFGDSSYNKPFGSLRELAGDVKLFADRMGLKEGYVRGWSTEILINETMKQVCLNELDWSLANINMSDSPNFYQKGDDTIKNVVCPCAFTSGELDMVVPRYMVMENVNAVKNSKLLAYEKCGHSPLVDCPDRLIKDITEFFA